MPKLKLPTGFKADNKAHLSNLKDALKQLHLLEPLPGSDGNEPGSARNIDEPLKTGIKEFQKKYKLRASGSLDVKTIEKMNKVLHDSFVTEKKSRTATLQKLLLKVDLPIDATEIKAKHAGETTRKAIEKFQKKHQQTADGIISEELLIKLHDEALAKKLESGTQRELLQRTLLKVNRVAGFNKVIAEEEVKTKTLGATSTEFIMAFQKKYRLPETGTIDKATNDKLKSVAASKGVFVKPLAKPVVSQLTPLSKSVRLNKVSPEVNKAQNALSFLGFKIAEKEFKTQRYGGSTRSAVLQFQQKYGLPQTGFLEKNDLKKLNSLLTQINPASTLSGEKFRLRGSVRDELWQRKPNMVIRAYEKLVDGESAEPLATKKNLSNGFFDITYNPPIDPVTGKAKEKFHLVIKYFEPQDNNPANDKLVATQVHYNVNRIHWTNYTEGGDRYRGKDDFSRNSDLIKKAIGSKNIVDIKETEADRQVTQIAFQTGLGTDAVMRVVLAHLAARSLNRPDTLTAELCYGFIRQNIPADLPGDLLRATSDWETIDILVERTTAGIVFINEQTQEQIIQNAWKQNIVSRRIKMNTDAALEELKNQRNFFALSKPILVGNQKLESLLATSSIATQHYKTLADTFIETKGINSEFWTTINQQESTIGEAAIKDFTTTVELGNLVKNDIDTISFLKTKIGVDPRLKSAGSLAKLSHVEIEALINENGNKVPANIPGDTTQEKVSAFAAAIKSRSEILYPALALIGDLKRSNTSKITKKAEIENFLDERPGLNIKTTNIDKFLADNPSITLDKETIDEVKVVQRVHKLAPNSAAAAALIDAGLHSSMQIYFSGKSNLKKLFDKQSVLPKYSTQVYELAKMQYLQVLARLIEFSPQTNTATPVAIAPQTFTKQEIKEAIGDIANIETLFGSLDYCDCPHCTSLYSPAAYLTDMLRFLKQHPAIDTTKSVKDILFERRPDIGNINLNCENTNTALPYIDLVCEILEHNIAPAQPNFTHQTTLTDKELRAVPQYNRRDAYKHLASQDFPMNVSFNLFQEETRAYLKYLRVSRHELMEAFQNVSNPAAKVPTDTTIAAEYFGISSHELAIITTAKPTAPDQDNFWNVDTTQQKVAVKQFMHRAQINYTQLLDVLMVRFVNDPATSARSEIERPADTCDISVQQITNLSPSRYDLIHRFLRLWRRTGWKMWELDHLLRNPKIGKGAVDTEAIANLLRFKKLQDELQLPFEVLLAFYSDINREVRLKPENPDQKIAPLYKSLFQNISITNPLDPNFKAVDDNDVLVNLDSSIVFDNTNPGNYTPVPTILSALALRQEDFEKLVGKTDNHLSVTSLSVLLRYTYFAKALKLGISDVLILLSLANASDPFADPKTTLECLSNLNYIRSSGLSLRELDYVLNHVPDSPIGLRKETLTQLIGLLRSSLADNKEKIAKLNLTEQHKSDVINFDADALVPLADPALIAAIAPLQTILSPVAANFTEAGFSVQETSFIIGYTLPMVNPETRNKLIGNIKRLQQNLTNFINIKAQVASSFGLTDSQTDILVSTLKVPASSDPLVLKLKDESLIQKNSDGSFKLDITQANFPEHFDIYVLLHKASLLVQKMKISDSDLKWFLQFHADVGTLNWSAIPVKAAISPNDFPKWLDLFKFLDFKAAYPEPEDASIRSILALGKDPSKSKDQVFDEISKLTRWNKNDVKAIDVALQLNHSAGNLDYSKAQTYSRLQKCFSQSKLTGVEASVMVGWSKRNGNVNEDIAAAQQARQAVKSKYEQDDWLQKITPIQDEIREKKRSALSSYLIENSQRTQPEKVTLNGKEIPNPLFWTDTNALFKHFLIDVEMGPLQQTSRIKQAISSVQLFVQRCFLNLENRFVQVTEDEKEESASENAWSQWKWMKNYRIWEANRKVFFYPENWIEPELRDDKTPFFQELESELMQNEVNKENIEAAFVNYLHKVDEVAKLQVCGLYHEMENLSGDESLFEINRVHVIGRTQAIPHVYYYRSYDMNYSNWSAWEKIDVDISGDHVVPVVYNRKLHLFWLQFMEKPMKVKKVPPAQPTNGPKDSPDPMNVLEIQLGWTIKKKAGWTPKRISAQKLVHPWERKRHTYNLKPYYLYKFNELYLDLYITTSSEFNDTLFYDPYQDKKIKLTKTAFNETLPPWHSSSFVFNGEVKGLDLKPLKGTYHLEPNVSQLTVTDSYNYVQTNYDPQGNTISVMDQIETGPSLKLPNGMHYEFTRLTTNKFHNANPSQLRVLEGNNTVSLLNKALSPFELVITQQDRQLDMASTDHPIFYQDNRRVFFIKPEWEALLDNYGQVLSHNRKYRFYPFYHPYTTLFLRELNRKGVDGLLNRPVQMKPNQFPPANTFNINSYGLTGSSVAEKTAQTDTVDFSFSGAYSIYNWELFFHAPLLIANRLMQNQKFEDAMTWFHFIFNPTNIENIPTPQRYWVTKPFFEFNSEDYRKQRIENILTNINLPEYKFQLVAAKNNPFKPHLIARYRPVAYQKAVVMKYLDNLLAWGDMLFRRDTMESINEATLLYMLGYEILGRRPEKVPNVKHEDKTFNQIESQLDAIANTKVELIVEDTLLPIEVVPSSNGTEPLPKIETFYFSIPNNENIIKYWDTVEDRLYKIRNSLNIQGVFRQLPLFEPPIDPALLVKAAAAGIDISSVLSDLSAPLPAYRFRVVVQKALEFCVEVKVLGDKLLQALEKRDIEEITLLRSGQEIQLLKAIKEVRQKQIDEAVETIGNLNKAKESAEEKKSYYESRPFMNPGEIVAMTLSSVSTALDAAVATGYIVSGGLKLIPSFLGGAAGFGGSPEVSVTLGGQQIGNGAEMAVRTLESIAKALDKGASIASTLGSYYRRKDDWDFQARLAAFEIDQMQFQINAAEIRQAIAEKELDNQDLQIENAIAVDEYMRNKYTSTQLYNWMVSQISTVYFQAYQLAYDMAKKAEKCFQYELGISESSFVQFGYWDSLKKGLLSGDRLMTDLRRLEGAYVEHNKREFEITKHISLAQMFPLNLIQIRETGKCTIGLPEWLFDMDYPGHYMRRIKNVSVSIPCITGPYTSINCTLSLVKNETRMDSVLLGGKYEKQLEDTRFKTMFGSISSIATSSGQNDPGMFELNFADERYLPFEGAGVISEWQIDLPPDNNYFDFKSLSDLVLHVSYTARNGGGTLTVEAKKFLDSVLPDSSARLLNLKQEYGTEWYKFLNPENSGDQEFTINLTPDSYPFFIRSKLNSLKIKSADVFIEAANGIDFKTRMKFTNQAYDPTDVTISPDLSYDNVHHINRDLAAGMPAALGELRMKVKTDAAPDFKSLPPDAINNVFVLLHLTK